MIVYLLKLFRNKKFLFFLLVISSVYFLVRIAKLRHAEKQKAEVVKPYLLAQKIDWKFEKKDFNSTETCRNSLQGLHLITDERGYSCPRSSVLANHCCPRSFKRYSCRTCHENHCCAVFEYCISCCLSPDNRLRLRKTFLRNVKVFPYLLSSVNDVYELCLSVCRTSSQSLHHENSYRDSTVKHCYGIDIPILKH